MRRKRRIELECLPGQRENHRPAMRDQDASHGEKFRKGEASRMVMQHEGSGGGNIDDSWDEVKSHVELGRRRTSRPARSGEDIRRRKKTIDDSPRSVRNRKSSRTSRSPYESGSSQARATDIFRTSKSRYKNAHSRDLPSCLRHRLPRAKDPPLSVRYDQATIPKTKEKDDMDRAAAV